MKLANIISTSDLNLSNEFNVVKTIDELIEGLPTLIIGYDYVNKHYPNFDITNIELGNNLYWTFKRNEKRDKYEEDLEWFKTLIFKKLISDINYVFIDVIQYNIRTIFKIVRKILSLKNIVTYVHKDMIYIYGEKIVFGLDLNLLNYMSINIDKIKTKIKEISDVFLDDNKIFIEYKKNVGMLGEQVRYIPFLYSIKNE